MPWPTAQDYQEAIQNPQFNCSDPELKIGVARVDRLGLPAVSSGRFATVYSMDCGPRRVAVRCFLKDYPDQQTRYREIAKSLELAKMPYTVSFDYIDKGILVRGVWYPVLKMEWVEGISFLDYIEKHRADSQILVRLAGDWLQMIRRCGYAGIAHGDLQHGNVLIANDAIKLVDYDGMFVPSLAGLPSNEIGHGNFQHPKRDETHYGAYLDNFSAWLIHASIIALSIDPRLWDQVIQRDEFILFHKKDLEHPDVSPFIQILRQHASPQIRLIADKLEKFLSMRPEQVPALEDTAVGSVPVDQTLEQHYRTLGLDTTATSKQVEESMRVWQRVWASSHYAHNRNLAKRAEAKLEALKLADKAIAKALKSSVP